MGYEIKGKVALVTGANRGIGKAIVEAFLSHGAAKVYAAVRNMKSVETLVKAHGNKVVPILIDLGAPDTIAAAPRLAKDVQVVVNNAGILHQATPLAADAIEALQNGMEINVYGLLRMARAFAPVLKANGGGAFVQLNSVVSIKAFPSVSTYSASKAAAYSITQSLREELAKQGTAVVSVHPGPIATDMSAAAGFQDIAEPPSVVAEAIVAALKAGEFHVFPDTVAMNIGKAYLEFAKAVVETEAKIE